MEVLLFHECEARFVNGDLAETRKDICIESASHIISPEPNEASGPISVNVLDIGGLTNSELFAIDNDNEVMCE